MLHPETTEEYTQMPKRLQASQFDCPLAFEVLRFQMP